MRTLACCILAIATLLGSQYPVKADLKVTGLHCEYLTNPLGIDAVRPRLGWVIESTSRGCTQKAYQIFVAGSREALTAGEADLWDSGEVASGESVQVIYAGKPLRSGQRVWWQVRVWDTSGEVSPYSEPAWWEMALLEPNDWTGQWIVGPRPEPATEEARYADDPAPLLRREFRVSKKVTRARAYVTGLGYYELRINGRRVGDHMLDPGWTTYGKRVLYSTYDVTEMLRDGGNAVGIMLGNGWFDPLPLRMWGRYNIRECLTVGKPRAILQLNIEYADGSRESVVTGTKWKVADGPIIRNSVYLGEVYDARREQAGWDAPGFDDSTWTAAKPAEAVPAPRVYATGSESVTTQPEAIRSPAAEATGQPVRGLGALRAQACPPIKIGETIKSVAITEPKPGVFILDMGRNLGGWVTLRVRGKAGDKVRLRYGELLHKDGTLNVMTSVCGQIKAPGIGGPGAPPLADQSETYICKGDGEEVYTPRFTFHGFRYVELTGYPGKPSVDSIEAHTLHTAVPSVGTFSCSSDLFNDIQLMVRRTLLSNLFSVQSDCPHREKFGYGGDVAVSSEMAMFNFDMAAFYEKMVYDYIDAVRPNDGFTETAPFVGLDTAGLGLGSGPVEWGSAHPILLCQLYQYYGNRRLMEEQYAASARWMKLLESKAADGILDNGLGDHETIETIAPKFVPLTGTAFYYWNARLLERMARLLNRTDDAKHYAAVCEQIRTAFNRSFLDEATGGYGNKSQCCQSAALFYDLVPAEQKAAALDVLARDIAARKGHLSTGIFGTKWMLNALTDCGRADLACKIAGQKDYPGWGHMLAGGATTQWEHWAFSDNTFSHNHPMFGSVSEWFYKALAGIRPDPEAVGFDRIIIRPEIVGDVKWARGEYQSIRGPIATKWSRKGEALRVEVIVPANATARVYLPAGSPDAVTEGGKPIKTVDGVQDVKADGGMVVCTVGSGRYEFAVTKDK